MKGIIRQNMGLSRYIVGVSAAQQPLQDEIKKYEALYEAASERLTEAKKVLGELRKVYWDALDVVADLAGDYEACSRDFSPTNCIATGIGACESAYFEADSACLDIESGPGTCDDDCQRERERCQAAADKAREACLAKVQIECSEAAYAHLVACQNTWSPQIAAAQAVAIELMPGVQEALYNRDHEQARQWQIARKLTELSGIEGRESQINCARAQWDDTLAVGTEVEMARTPNWRNVITGIVTAPTPCFHDARVLPSGHLFVNAALAPGFETWRPTWRVGTVKKVISPKLKVEFAPAIIHGSLGTVDSQNINCTPPQCYFDGKDPKAAEADIRAARTALTEAQQALVDAVALRADCLAVYDQAWMDQCYGAAVELCDDAFDLAMEQPTLDNGQCYDDAQGNCEAQTTAGLEACADAYQPDIDDAQADVDAATAVLDQATSDLMGALNALGAIEAEIQECVDAVNTQAWLDAERDRLTGLCAEAADDRKQECLDNGNTAAECQLVRDAIYADCVALIDEQLPLRQAAARDKCQADRQADVDAAEGVIDAAYTAVNNAEIALRQVTGALEIAEKALADCLDQWVLGDCLASAIQICDDTYGLAEDTYTQQRAACYQEAMAECDRQRDEAIDACYAAHADAIDAAQTAVDEATRDVEIATNGRYHPADPLILDVPVAHCGAGQYKVDDEVLIDFPVRSGETAMAVWDSARVIGWAADTRKCSVTCRYLASGGLTLLGEEQISPTEVTQEIPAGEDGTSVAVIDDDNIVFWKWDDDTEEEPQRENPRVDEEVEEGFTVTAVPIVFPEQVIGWLHWNIMLPNYSSGDIGSQVIEENKITNTFSGEIDTDYPGGEWRNHFYGWAIGSSRIVLSTNAPGDFEIAGMQNGYILIHEAIADIDVPEDPYGTITGNSIWYSPAGNSIWPTTLPWRKEIADITRGWRSGYNYAIGLYSQEFMTTDELMNDIGGQKSLTLIHKESGVSKIYNYSYVSSYDQSLVYL